ncbi:hypothetical protein ACFX2F_039552 [Malus domestica]
MSWKTLKHPGSRRIKKAFVVLRSSFFQDQAPTALEESVIRSSFFQDQAPTALWINNHPPIQDQAPTALEESVLRSSFIVLPRSSPDGPWINHPPIQDQAPTALEESTIVHHPFIQDQAPTALWINNVDKSTHPTVSSRSSPKALEDPLKSTFKDQAHDPLKKLPTVHPRLSLDGPWINETPTNQHLTEIESEDQMRERLNFPCSQIGTPGGTSLPLISFSVQEIQAHLQN